MTMAARVLKGEKLEQEMARLEAMAEYEKEYDACTYICGIDEAGRGPLAGPVAAGAVVLPKGCRILYLNDSKKLSEKRREELFLEIKEKAVAWNVGLASPARIDEINILQPPMSHEGGCEGAFREAGSASQRRCHHSRAGGGAGAYY